MKSAPGKPATVSARAAALTQHLANDLNEIAASVRDFHVDAAVVSVDGVLQQFLDDAGWPLDVFLQGR